MYILSESLTCKPLALNFLQPLGLRNICRLVQVNGIETGNFLSFFKLTSCRIGHDQLELSQEPSSRKLKAQSKSWWLEGQMCLWTHGATLQQSRSYYENFFRFRICHSCLQQVNNENEGFFLRNEFDAENLVCRTALSTVASAKGLDLQRSKCYEQILDQIFGDFTVSFNSMT